MGGMFEHDKDKAPAFIMIGDVCDDKDPQGRHRVMVDVPGVGIVGWCKPLGGIGGGCKDNGGTAASPVGAEVGVFFNMGDWDDAYYISGSRTKDEMPEETDGGDPKVKCVTYEDFRITIDLREGSRSLTVVNRKNNDMIVMDSDQNSIVIQATTIVRIKAASIHLDAPMVQIKDRVVSTTGNAPING